MIFYDITAENTMNFSLYYWNGEKFVDDIPNFLVTEKNFKEEKEKAITAFKRRFKEDAELRIWENDNENWKKIFILEK